MRGMNRNLAIAFVLLISLGYPAKSGAVDFAPPKTYPVGTSASAVVVGDFNGDGKSDMAVANFGSANVSILLGNGDGTYQPAVNFDAGLSPNSIAVGDFNGNGKLDLAVFQAGNTSNATAGAISILLGNGNGTFQAPKTTALTEFSSVVAVADFNLDQKSDLAVSSVDSSTGAAVVTLSILLGKGDGTFQPAKQTPVPNPSGGALASADFNRDSKPDLAVVTSAGILILLGKDDGTFLQRATVAVADGFTPNSVQTADLNLDGGPDLVVRSSQSGRGRCPGCPPWTIQHLSSFFSNGDGSFQGEHMIATASSTSFSIFSSGDSIAEVAVGDFNGDGKVDVAYRRIKSGSGASLEIVLGKGNGSFSSPVVMSDLGPVLVAENLNADKLSDLIARGTANDIAVLLNTSPASGSDLGILQSGASADSVGVGTNLTYTADVLNQGPQHATGVTFTDTLPNGVNFVSAIASQGSCVQSHGIVSCTIGSLPSAFDSTVSIVVTPRAPGTITNSMSVTANESDLVLTNNSATQNTTVDPVFTLTVAKTGNGSGTIQSNSTIDCGTTCSATFLSGTLVSLSAVPSASSTFSNWSGACTGTDPNGCSVTLNSDQSVTASFNLLPDFTLTPAAMSLTLKRGGQVSDVLTFPAQGDFTGTIALACSVSGPSPAPTCGISPSSVTPGNSATLTVNAAALSAALTAPWFEQGARLYAACLPLGLLGCVLATGFDKKRRRLWALCLLMMAVTLLPTACGGGSSGPPPPVTQTFTARVTATSGAIQHSTNVTVTVQ
jgi:uncharacterized repeat protein (TIGR01451 family)